MAKDNLKVRNPELKRELYGMWEAIEDNATPVQIGAPTIAVAATGTLTFAGVVADGETVTIGADVYEFDADSSVTEGNIAVDISGGATAPDAVTALVAASASGTELVTLADGAGDTVTVTADVRGVLANAIATTETCTNGSFGAATLAGGVDGTVCTAGTIFAGDTKLYVAKADCTISSSNFGSISFE